tara:strand:- start:394 stop:1038 length:645 start_codon:yes stop_codon:yes gene_type:complete
MEEDLSVINTNTKIEKIKNLFIDNKKLLISLIVLLILILISFFGFKEYQKNQKVKVSDYYNSTIIKYSPETRNQTANNLIEVINKKDSTYSPLALYFIIDNKLISDDKKINDLFDLIINKTSLEKEIKNLIIYKKALFNADRVNENELLAILNPVINSDSVWRSHSLYLIAEFFYSKNQKQKSKDFFNKILLLKDANIDILKETQKRLNRDLSD